MAQIQLRVVGLVVVLSAVILYGAEAAEYTVGDSTGWQTPTTDSSFYTTWASNKNFQVGDILTFNFATGVHDVATVAQAAYTNCNTANTLSVIQNGPANITLTSGTHYYICTFDSHCSSGQKFTVTVGGSSSPGSPPTTNGTTSPPPPPSSSASTLAATYALMFMFIVISFLCHNN